MAHLLRAVLDHGQQVVLAHLRRALRQAALLDDERVEPQLLVCLLDHLRTRATRLELVLRSRASSARKIEQLKDIADKQRPSRPRRE